MWFEMNCPRMNFHTRCDRTTIAVNQLVSLRRIPSSSATEAVVGSRPTADSLGRRRLDTPHRHARQSRQAMPCATDARLIREAIR
jgi:hypothetical protein